MNGEDNGGSSIDSDEMAQTMMEIDYETIIDDDTIDEFIIFKGVLGGAEFCLICV